jgi:hypothetical protein
MPASKFRYGHKVDPACPAQVCRRKILGRHAAFLDDLPRPGSLAKALDVSSAPPANSLN